MVSIPRYKDERWPPGPNDERWLQIGGRDGELYDAAISFRKLRRVRYYVFVALAAVSAYLFTRGLMAVFAYFTTR